jgi:poly(A) polymerase
VEHLSRAGEGVSVRAARPHGQFGTVEAELEFDPHRSDQPDAGDSVISRLLLDVATARAETYPVPAENPVVRYGSLEDDLARRDLSINAMAIDLDTGDLIDPHGGQEDLARRRLRFLHPASLREDPTRLVRAARYAARLDFELAPDSASQATCTLEAWPWLWSPGDSPGEAPPALGTRLRRELELLLEGEGQNWCEGLARLQAWGGLVLLDPQLQADPHWPRRLHWAIRLRLPLLLALIAVAQDPLALAERLQIPHRQHTILRQFQELRRRLAAPASADPPPSTPWQWCQLLEAPGLSPQAVALALACGLSPRRPLLRWVLRWRHLGPEVSAQELIAAGVPKGPELGEQLRRSRQLRLERERP